MRFYVAFEMSPNSGNKNQVAIRNDPAEERCLFGTLPISPMDLLGWFFIRLGGLRCGRYTRSRNGALH
jgi:hypothetical protein